MSNPTLALIFDNQIANVLQLNPTVETKQAGLEALVVQNEGSVEAADELYKAMTRALERNVPRGFDRMNDYFLALREARGPAIEAYYNARVAAGLPRFEFNCGGDCCPPKEQP